MQDVEVIREELVDIQQTVIDMGGLIEKVKGEANESVRSLEKFCDIIYEMYQGNNADMAYVQSYNMRNMYIKKLTKFAGKETENIWNDKIYAKPEWMTNR